MLNPVFRREIRTALRTWKSLTVITIYILLLVGAAGLFLISSFSSMAWNGFHPRNTVDLYKLLSGFQAGLITLIVPALLSSAISGERERQTLDLMLVTKMSAFSIIVGKLCSSLMVVTLMLVASLPVFGIIMYYGSVSLLTLLTTFLYTFAIAVFSGCIALLFSVIFRKTIVALIMTYFVMGVLSVATLAGVAITCQVINSYATIYYFPQPLAYSILTFNPFLGFLSVLDTQTGSNFVLEMISNLTYRYEFAQTLVNKNIEFPLWIVNLCINFALSLVAIILASRLINPTRKSKKLR